MPARKITTAAAATTTTDQGEARETRDPPRSQNVSLTQSNINQIEPTATTTKPRINNNKNDFKKQQDLEKVTREGAAFAGVHRACGYVFPFGAVGKGRNVSP